MLAEVMEQVVRQTSWTPMDEAVAAELTRLAGWVPADAADSPVRGRAVVRYMRDLADLSPQAGPVRELLTEATRLLG